ncbi:cupin domain-containing protein [Rhizobium sp. CNPSo 4039]|uniref:cupin domain-containing protein n=1 Tax=Rhizobium sp. CNPSo 4039 TaxID=3021409 RepID=UPI00254C65DE|nr:cupin domain-containing protein [Rhizobium sp. CNPSo 4039]MDK4715767.1 cupin domain-containing protein [Rhizobium sp. CNPSo 4039]
MTLLKTVVTNPGTAPRESKALPERLIAGDPSFKTWAQDEAKDGTVRTGVWEATPGETRSIKGETFEFCHILSGVVEITADDGEPMVYRAGDSFVMKPGFVGRWKTIETVRKIYVTVG